MPGGSTVSERNRSCAMQSDAQAIDEITHRFFAAFGNAGGHAANIDDLYRILIPQAVIVSNSGDSPIVYNVESFVEPRRALLGNGTLSDFREWETSGRTDVFGNIAQRAGTYAKSWTAGGRSFEQTGAKTLQFIRTPEGWRISAFAWDDD
jgi:ribosomal-protein-serine acetyltransferase